MDKAAQSFDYFFSVIKRLRAPDGCPWDKEQTPLSLRTDLIEEVFEASEAISDRDVLHTQEELGDVMLNAVMVAYMHEQNKDFSVADVFFQVAEKLVRRHPHVFKDSEGSSQMTKDVNSSDEVLSQWDAIKRNVEGRQASSVLDEVPKGFPPLLKAYKLQKKAAKKGFDWKHVLEVKAKVYEELEEVDQATAYVQAEQKISANNGEQSKPFVQSCPQQVNEAQLHLEEEIGDLLFAVVNLARHLGVDPCVALARTNAKFCRRFGAVEKNMKAAGIPMDANHLAQMDSFWEEAKQNGL